MPPDHKTILVVDDEAAVQKITATMLRSHGFNVLNAFSGREAVNALKKDPVPLVVTDVQMPQMDGKELLRLIKRDFRQTKVIVVSGSGSYDATEFKLRGALGFLPKPIDFTRLVKLARHALSLEKRVTSRYPARIPVLIDGQVKGQVHNISADGILLSTDKPLTNGKTTRITLQFPEQNKSLETEGSLVRTAMVDSLHLTAFYFLANIGMQLSEYIASFAPAGVV